MNDEDVESVTIETYNMSAKIWEKTHTTEKFWGEGFTYFEQLVPAGSKVLEIGAGAGRDAKELIPKYEYTGTDASASFVTIAKENNPSGTFFHQYVYNLKFHESTFDAFWAAAVLLHIPKLKINTALKEIHRVVRPQGIGFISLKEGEGEKLIEEKNGGKRFFAFYTAEEFTHILERNQFDVLDSKTMHFENVVWLMFFVKVKE